LRRFNNKHISLTQTADKECRVLIEIKAAAISIFSIGLVNPSEWALDL
jgi:hypothetical protein